MQILVIQNFLWVSDCEREDFALDFAQVAFPIWSIALFHNLLDLVFHK